MPEILGQCMHVQSEQKQVPTKSQFNHKQRTMLRTPKIFVPQSEAATMYSNASKYPPNMCTSTQYGNATIPNHLYSTFSQGQQLNTVSLIDSNQKYQHPINRSKSQTPTSTSSFSSTNATSSVICHNMDTKAPIYHSNRQLNTVSYSTSLQDIQNSNLSTPTINYQLPIHHNSCNEHCSNQSGFCLNNQSIRSNRPNTINVRSSKNNNNMSDEIVNTKSLIDYPSIKTKFPNKIVNSSVEPNKKLYQLYNQRISNTQDQSQSNLKNIGANFKKRLTGSRTPSREDIHDLNYDRSTKSQEIDQNRHHHHHQQQQLNDCLCSPLSQIKSNNMDFNRTQNANIYNVEQRKSTTKTVNKTNQDQMMITSANQLISDSSLIAPPPPPPPPPPTQTMINNEHSLSSNMTSLHSFQKMNNYPTNQAQTEFNQAAIDSVNIRMFCNLGLIEMQQLCEMTHYDDLNRFDCRGQNLPNSNSTNSSLSAGDDRNYFDSGISSSSYSKDSSCTSPLDQNSNKSLINSTTIMATAVTTNMIASSTVTTTTVNSINNNNSIKHTHYDISANKSCSNDKYKKSQSNERMHQMTHSTINPASSTRTLRAQSMENEQQCTNRSFHHLSNLIKQTSESNPLTDKSSSRYLKSLPIMPNMISPPINKKAISTKSTNKQTNKLPTSTDKSRVKSQSRDSVIQSCSPVSETKQSRLLLSDAKNRSDYPPLRSNVHMRSEPPPNRIVSEKQRLTLDQLMKGKKTSRVTSTDKSDEVKHPANNDNKENWKRSKNFHASIESNTSTDISYSSFACDRKPINKLNTVNKDTSNHIFPSGVVCCDEESVKSTIQNQNHYHSQQQQQLQYDLLSDPTDLLLSSLSKLTEDQSIADHDWDQNCFSDVENEYAALELILPIPKRESMTECSDQFELDNQIANHTKTEIDTTIDNVSVNTTTTTITTNYSTDTVTTTTTNVSDNSNLAILEPNYFSDTETNSFCQRKSNRQTYDLVSLSSTTGRLPIASVAPIMSTKTMDTVATITAIGYTPTTATVVTESASLPTDQLICLQHTKWPRLCSLQNLVEEMQKVDNQSKLYESHGQFVTNNHTTNSSVNKWTNVASSAISINNNDDLNNNNNNNNNNNVVSNTTSTITATTTADNLLSQIKLPYPTVSVDGGLVSYGISRRKSTSQLAQSDSQKNGDKQQEMILANSKLIKSFQRDIKQLNEEIHRLTVRLASKENVLQNAEESMESLHVRIEQLTVLNKLKDAEIQELQELNQQLRMDDLCCESITNSLHKLPIQSKCTKSQYGQTDHMGQELQDTLSLNSLTSGVSAVSQDVNAAVKKDKKSVNSSTTATTIATVNHASNSPTMAYNERCSMNKNSKWIRSSLSKAFWKRSKSNLHAPEDSENSDDSKNVPKNFEMAKKQIAHQDQIEHLNSVLNQMRRQMCRLEIQNQKLRQQLLHFQTSQITDVDNNNNIYMDKQSTVQNLDKSKHNVSLADLIGKYCQDSCYTVQVFAECETIQLHQQQQQQHYPHQHHHRQQTNSNESKEKLKEMNNQLIDDLSTANYIRSFKIGSIGLNDQLTWDQLDEKLRNLIQDHLAYLESSSGDIELPIPKLHGYQIKCQTNGSDQLISEHGHQYHYLTRCMNHNNSDQFCLLNVNSETEFLASPIKWLKQLHSTDKLCNLSIVLHFQGSNLRFSDEPNLKQRTCKQLNKFDLYLDNLCFITLIPKADLKFYLEEMYKWKITILCGSSGEGNSQLALELGRCLTNDAQNFNAVQTIVFKSDEQVTVNHLQELIDKLITNHNQPQIINLINLHEVQGSVNEILSCLHNFCCSSQYSPKFIGTSYMSVDEMKAHCDSFPIKLINPLNDPIKTKKLLTRKLNRKLAQFTLFTTTPCEAYSLDPSLPIILEPDLQTIINWLPELWMKLNKISNLISQSNYSASIFGLRTFLTCPIHKAMSLNWFLDLWNQMLIPFLFATNLTKPMNEVKTQNNKKLIEEKLDNLLDWLMITWPWNPLWVNFPLSRSNPQISIDKDNMKLTTTTSTISNQLNGKLLMTPLTNKNRTSLDSGIIPDGFCFTNTHKIDHNNEGTGGAQFDQYIMTNNYLQYKLNDLPDVTKHQGMDSLSTMLHHSLKDGVYCAQDNLME